MMKATAGLRMTHRSIERPHHLQQTERVQQNRQGASLLHAVRDVPRVGIAREMHGTRHIHSSNAAQVHQIPHHVDRTNTQILNYSLMPPREPHLLCFVVQALGV